MNKVVDRRFGSWFGEGISQHIERADENHPDGFGFHFLSENFFFEINVLSFGIGSKALEFVIQTLVVDEVSVGEFFFEFFVVHHQPMIEVFSSMK